MTVYATDVFVVHGLCGNQIGIRASKIVSVTQGVNDNYTRIYVDDDPEPITAQESWQTVMFQWTGDSQYSDQNVLANLLQDSENSDEE